MEEYLVTMPHADWNNIIIVPANSSKDAINQVFEKEFEWRNIALQ